MRQLPFRPGNEISQTFNSGVCTVYSQEDRAKAGYQPKPKLKRKAFLRYEEQRLGLNRFTQFRQVDSLVERVFRVPQGPAAQNPTPRDVVKDGVNGLFYRIELVQTVPGVWPKCLDLTLVQYERGTAAAAGNNTQSAAKPLTAPLPKEPLSPAGGTKGE